MDFTLSTEQDLIRATAREFCAREIDPFAREWDRTETMDRGIVAKLAGAGFLGAALPEEHGGMGLDAVSYCLLCEELGRSDSSVRGIVSVSNGLYGKTLAKWGTDEQKRAWLPPLCSGESLGCYALTEPGSGSDPGSLTTRAERDRRRVGAQRLEDLHHARNLGVRRARLRAHERRGGARDHVLRRPDRRGGLRGALDQGEARAARAGHGRALPRRCSRWRRKPRRRHSASGFKVAMSALDNGRISLAAGCVGIAQGCLDASVGYAKERRQFGKPVAGFQLVQELLADIAVETEAARLLTWRAAALSDSGQKHTVESSHAKYFASEVSVRAANAAVQVHGGYGYVDEYPVGKYLRDARVTTLYEGTSQIQKLIIGRALTGESAFT